MCYYNYQADPVINQMCHYNYPSRQCNALPAQSPQCKALVCISEVGPKVSILAKISCSLVLVKTSTLNLIDVGCYSCVDRILSYLCHNTSFRSVDRIVSYLCHTTSFRMFSHILCIFCISWFPFSFEMILRRIFVYMTDL